MIRRRKPIARTSVNKGKRTSARRKKRKASMRDCDRLWSQLVRTKNDGRCYLIGRVEGHTCNGPIQAAHGFSRRYRGTRWNLLNGWPMCSAGHLRLTYDPIGWDMLITAWWGEELYQEMRAKALAPTKVDYAEVLAYLKDSSGRSDGEMLKCSA